MDALGLDLNLLPPLLALLKMRHVTRAAEKIHLSQPAMSATLSRQMKSLVECAFSYATRRSRVSNCTLGAT